ncbi:methyltransferase domain-containing protein, partial [Arthrobacter sp. JCM 19049]
MKWEPSTYTEFADYRGRPYLDLMARVEHLAPKKIVDLGCGPGNMTRLLAERWPEALVLGLDSSRQMIDTAHAGDNPPNLRFELADATSWQADDTIDLLFSNAMLQWIPGHLQLLRGWLRQLESEAAIAIQVPGNFDSP